jgi:hypothetical protein
VAVKDEIVEQAENAMREKTKDARMDGIEAAFERAGFKERWPERDTVAEFSELTATQQGVVRAFASDPHFAAILGWGLPQRARELCRFVGSLPPGPLERQHPTAGVARFRYLESLMADTPWPEAVEAALVGLPPDERFQGALELASEAYTLSDRAGWDYEAGHLKKLLVKAGQAGVPFAREVLSRRFEHGPWDPFSTPYLPDQLHELMDGLEELGVAIEPAWRDME